MISFYSFLMSVSKSLPIARPWKDVAIDQIYVDQKKQYQWVYMTEPGPSGSKLSDNGNQFSGSNFV